MFSVGHLRVSLEPMSGRRGATSDNGIQTIPQDSTQKKSFCRYNVSRRGGGQIRTDKVSGQRSYQCRMKSNVVSSLETRRGKPR